MNDPACPLCNVPPEEVIKKWPGWKLARTKKMKGHRERVMIYNDDHANRAF